jgi:PAS domain S-box-containing protein
MSRIDNYLKLFEHAPVATAILSAETLRVDLANEAMLKLWKREPSVIGMKLLDIMPELERQPYPEMIREVLRTGKFHHESGSKVIINRDGKLETIYVDYSYTRIEAEENEPAAILVLAADISEREVAKNALEESDRNLRALVMSAPVPMCVFRGEELKPEMVNDSMRELWHDHHELRMEPLKHVFHNGITYTEKINDILYSYTPLRDGLGRTSGVVLIVNRMDS